MADDAVVVLERAQEAGLIVWLEGSDLKVKGQQEPTPQTRAVVESLKKHKEEVITYLRQYGDANPRRWTGRLLMSKNSDAGWTGLPTLRDLPGGSIGQ